MDGTTAVVTVAVALITAGIPAWFGFRKQHAASFGLLQRLDERTERIDQRIDDHLIWHRETDR
jgi:CHASE1-domain containing sensor protein